MFNSYRLALIGDRLTECLHALGTDMKHACGALTGSGLCLTQHPSSLQLPWSRL